jgi:hypothetical protein
MPSLRCPSCGRALNFTDALRGALVQCPACRHNFIVPEEEPPDPPRPPLATPVSRPAPVGPVPETFDFDGPEDEQVVRQRKALRSAAWWLRSAVVVDFCTTLLGCCTLPVLTNQPDTAALCMLAGTALLGYLPLIVVATGITPLRERRNYRRCLASAVAVLPPSLWGLLLTWVVGTAGLGELARGEAVGFFFLALAAGTLFGAAAGVTGAVKTFALLSDAEVRRSFH